MPEYNLKFAGNPETTTRKRLMIVCHPDDEVIFGGEELLNHPGEWVVVYITNDHRRPKGVKKMVEALNLNEAIIFGLADSMVDEFKYPIEFVEEIYKLLCSQVWDQIATHGEDGEYGHRQHIALHQIVYHLMQKVGIFANNWTKITDFTLDTKLHRTSNKENIMKRQELCRDIYYRSNKKWMRMIEKSGTVTHRSNTDKSDYDITDLLCE
ncbi:hypothetical protein SARC_01686 [Sphaeroforma arctica JP610]|uniref:N-acetylglucosaminylphosphatidylinositol deacetylase n=1 Tax=Sphaeroforma arctica JP610 TaxID=667725 RepID=A0A0L0GAZ0_9EUKA|nr:hypothetical protein SARC_01686 [Sphaeroforma arctica JP610]KNC86160.1 hypothetical protein SARC_01686 [Sphaeroforma arctica JP610]|eukprot:XP_014160062.1 hypothetical protein SARC_01686 [Sphaeroforma arctica JP610]